jgi:hypothetical protein
MSFAEHPHLAVAARQHFLSRRKRRAEGGVGWEVVEKVLRKMAVFDEGAGGGAGPFGAGVEAARFWGGAEGRRGRGAK